MKAKCYLQLVPLANRSGTVWGFAVKNATKRAPSVPIAGALVIALELEIPDATFKPLAVSVRVPLEAIVRQEAVVATADRP